MSGLTVFIGSGNLFQIADQYLGDATQWDRIAALNGLADPFFTGLTSPLNIPARAPGTGDGGVIAD